MDFKNITILYFKSELENSTCFVVLIGLMMKGKIVGEWFLFIQNNSLDNWIFLVERWKEFFRMKQTWCVDEIVLKKIRWCFENETFYGFIFLLRRNNAEGIFLETSIPFFEKCRISEAFFHTNSILSDLKSSTKDWCGLQPLEIILSANSSRVSKQCSSHITEA
jgi:hypothetical protein